MLGRRLTRLANVALALPRVPRRASPTISSGLPTIPHSANRDPGDRRKRLSLTAGAASMAMLLPSVGLATDGDTTESLLQTKSIRLTAGALLGWVGKLLADNINGRLAARREFIRKTTGQISDLAKEH